MSGDSAGRIRVAVVAHDPRARTSLLHLLASHDNFVVVSHPAPDECGARHALAAAGGPSLEHPVDVIVIDLAPLPPEDRDARLAALPGSVAIVVLGNDCATAAAARTIDATYLDKVDVADQLLAAVHTAAVPRRPTTGRSPARSSDASDVPTKNASVADPTNRMRNER